MNKSWYYQQCLNEELSERLRKNAQYSLRSFARSLEIDAGDLSKILSGQKMLTPNLAKKTLAHLSLSPKNEKQFLYSMAQAYEETGVKRKKPEIKKILKNAHNKIPERDLTPEMFRVISDWYHFAILQLMKTKNAQSNVKWIAQQLNIQEIEAKLAVDRLLELELLIEENGKLIRAPGRATTGDTSLTAPALRKRIKQISEKSIHSLENDPIEQRNHTTMTVAIDPEKMQLAKKLIDEFMNRLATALGTNKKRVYELQVNLFPLQRNEK